MKKIFAFSLLSIIVFMLIASVSTGVVYANGGANIDHEIDMSSGNENEAGESINDGMNAGLNLLINWILPGVASFALAYAGYLWIFASRDKKEALLSIVIGIMLVTLAPKLVMLLINGIAGN